MFSSGSVMSTFRSLIHFEFIFVFGVRKCSNFILLHVVLQFSWYHLLKRLFSIVYSCLLCQRFCSVQFSSVQSLSRVQFFATPWIAACKASLSITNSRSLLKVMSIELVMLSSHLILCHPLLLLSPIPPSIRVFSNESTLRTRWPKYWSFSFSINPSNEHPGLISSNTILSSKDTAVTWTDHIPAFMVFTWLGHWSGAGRAGWGI